MSKQATVACTITEAHKDILERGLQLLLEHKNGKLTINEEEFRFRCPDLSFYNVNVAVKNGQIEIRGEEGDIDEIREVVQQYYIAAEIEQEYNSPVELDEEGDLVLQVEV